MTGILQVKGLTVQFGGVMANSDITFDLEKGMILGVIGPNGAGKTTMFDAISGFVPSRGTVVLDGTTISGIAPEARSRHGLGRSFQDAKLFPSLTVAETLAVAYERHIKRQDIVSTAFRMPWVSRAEKRIKAQVEGLIELMGLGAFRDKFIAELSTGSRRIVDLAVIMAHNPKVLLLDEPSSGIAQKETEALGPLLLRMRDETGATLVVVEHDMPLIQSISDELLALETGAVLMRGTPQEVIEDPRLIASYLGTDQSAISRSGAVHKKAEPVPVKRTARKRTPVKKVAAKKVAARKVVAKKTSVQARRAQATAIAKKKKATVTKAAATKKVAKKATPVAKAPARAKRTAARSTR